MAVEVSKSSSGSGAQTGIFSLIGVVVVAGVLGSIFSKENTVQILGFCSITVVSLLGLLQAMLAAVKVEEVAVKTQESAKIVSGKVDQVADKAESAAQRVAARVAEAAIEVQEVKRVLGVAGQRTDSRLDNLAMVTLETNKTGKEIHTLVDGAMTAQLSLNATISRRLAVISTDPADALVADKAEKLYQARLEALSKAEAASKKQVE